MEYYCHKPPSPIELVAALDHLKAIGTSTELVVIDGSSYLKIGCPPEAKETFIGNNWLPDYLVTIPGRGKFTVRKLMHRPKLLDQHFQCILFIVEGNCADN